MFASDADFAHLPSASEALVSSANGGTFALPPPVPGGAHSPPGTGPKTVVTTRLPQPSRQRSADFDFPISSCHHVSKDTS